MLGKFAPPPEEIAFGHAYIYIHGVQLIDGSQKGGLGGDQSAFVEMAATDSAVHGSGDQGVIEIEFRFDQIALRGFQRGLGCQRFGYGIINIFSADGLFLEQRLHASQILLRLDQPRLSLGHSGLAIKIGGFKGDRIDEI